MDSKPKSSPISFKVALLGADGKQLEVRKFNLEKVEAVKFDSIKQKISKAFPSLKKNLFTVSYKDLEGDNVTISTDEELKFVTQQKSVVSKLQVHFLPLTSCNGDTKPPIKNKVVHRKIICNVCKQEIQGTRYRCVVCVDYDICHGCELISVHEHAMLKLPKPINNVECLVGSVCKMLNVLLKEQECNHKDCSSCLMRRKCSGPPLEGSITKSYCNLSMLIDQQAGKCGKCVEIKPAIKENGLAPKIPLMNVPPNVQKIGQPIKPMVNGNANLMRTVTTMNILRVPPMCHQMPGAPQIPMMNHGPLAQGPPLHYVGAPNFFHPGHHFIRPAHHGPPLVHPMNPYPNPHQHMVPVGPAPFWNQQFPPQAWDEHHYHYPNPNVLSITPKVATPSSTQSPFSGNSQRSSPKSEEESVDVQIQRAVLELSAKGYVGDVEKLGETLRSVDLNVEKACKILDKEKSG